jgi:hypothetical protein
METLPAYNLLLISWRTEFFSVTDGLNCLLLASVSKNLLAALSVVTSHEQVSQVLSSRPTSLLASSSVAAFHLRYVYFAQ